MAEFRNLEEFYLLIHNVTAITIEYVTEKILEELNIQMANKKIGLHNNSFYTPTGDFYSAWKSDIAIRVGEYFTSTVRFDGDSMRLDPDNFTHGSNYYEIDDVRDIMPWIIFGGNSGGLFGQGYWTQERDAWSPTIARVNKSFNKWIRDGFKIGGFEVSSEKVYKISDMEV